MVAFLVGLLVILIIGAFSLVGFLLWPLLVVFGIVLQMIVSLLLFLFMIWVVGKATLYLIDYMRRQKPE